MASKQKKKIHNVIKKRVNNREWVTDELRIKREWMGIKKKEGKTNGTNESTYQ